jgi:hypothetical protein
MAQMSRENMKGHVAFGGLDRDLQKINDHQNIFHVVYDLSIPTFLPRQFVSRIVWKWAGDKKELTVVADSVKNTDFPERKEYLRASATGMYQYKQEAEVGELPQTKVTFTQQVDLGGVIPKWAQNRQGVGTLMYVLERASYFCTPLIRRSRQVFEHDAEALRQGPGDRRGKRLAPGGRDPEPRRAVHAEGGRDSSVKHLSLLPV